MVTPWWISKACVRAVAVAAWPHPPQRGPAAGARWHVADPGLCLQKNVADPIPPLPAVTLARR
jgi:hypothetical protein